MISKAAIPDFHALLARRIHRAHFDPQWHYHPEYELIVVLEGTGTRFVGDHVQRFGPGDLVLTGPNLPHLWRSDEAYFAKDNRRLSEGIIIYFRDAVVSDRFLATEEGLKIRQLLTRSESGLTFHGETRDRISRALVELYESEGFDRVLRMLRILHDLSISEESQILSKQGYADYLHASDQERLRNVVSHIMEHFTEPLRLGELASVAHMSETAFCRYFKARTNLPPFQFIRNLRIGYACKLLVEDDSSIARVAASSGYATLSNFNMHFKVVTGLTARAYRRKYAETL